MRAKQDHGLIWYTALSGLLVWAAVACRSGGARSAAPGQRSIPATGHSSGAGSRNADPVTVLSVTPEDTTRPPVPAELGAPSPIVTLAIEGGELIFRNMVDVRFDDSTSGKTIRAFLSHYGATIVGGRPITKVYVLGIPDPGSTWEAYNSVVSAMRSESGVAGVTVVSVRGVRINSRFPNDASTHGADRQGSGRSP